MMRRVFEGSVVFLALTGLVLAQPPQAPPPAQPGQQGNANGPGRGGGRGPIPIGPPAPAPAQVAIPRPTPAEIEQVNAAVKKWIDADKSAVKPLLQKVEPLLMLETPRVNVAATYTASSVRMGARHDACVEMAKKGNVDLLLDGDSITDYWSTSGDANKAVFDKYFGAYKTANFAVAGDTTQGLLWGLKNGEADGIQPKAIMLMIGTNNTGGNNNAGSATAAEIAEGIGAVVLEMRNDFPQAKILLLGVFPRGLPGDSVRDKIAEMNRLISKLDDQRHIFYMDIGAKFLDEKGSLIAGTFRPDNVHPTASGYEIWGTAIKDKIAELMR